MTLPEKLLLSDLLKHRVRCDQGIDHGPGLIGWMHPPVHRLLGWSTRPSNVQLNRHVWRLDQLRGIGDQELYVKGRPSIVEQVTLDRLPTLLASDTLNLNGVKVGSVVDLVFDPKTGKVFHYLIARTDPRIPGTSRWRLLIDRILDQQPGMVSINIISLDDLPLERSSIKQQFLRRSRNWKEQFQDLSDQASTRLEGWLEEPPWDEPINNRSRSSSSSFDLTGDWGSDFEGEQTKDHLESSEQFRYSRRSTNTLEAEDDPWI